MDSPVQIPKDKNPLKLNINGLFIAVFGASGSHAKYEKVASNLAESLYNNKMNIVYGGGAGGIMGAGPVRMNELGGQVIGILPKVWEFESGPTPGILYLVDTLSERKNLFFDYACAFVAIPGGFGTMDEICEYITWRQMGVHTKPIILLNVDNFFEGFLIWIDRAVKEGLIRESCKEILVVVSSVEQVISHLNAHRAELAPNY